MTTRNQTDEEHSLLESLVFRAQQGERDAVTQLIEVTHQRLYRFFLFLTHNTPLAQDLCQDTYLRMLEKLHAYRHPGKFFPWLVTLGRNIFLDHVKSPRNRPHLTIDQAREQFQKQFEAPNRDSFHQIAQALGTLKEEDRMLILLIDSEGYSYAEAAVILGISEAAVRSRIHRVRQAFEIAYEKP